MGFAFFIFVFSNLSRFLNSILAANVLQTLVHVVVLFLYYLSLLPKFVLLCFLLCFILELSFFLFSFQLFSPGRSRIPEVFTAIFSKILFAFFLFACPPTQLNGDFYREKSWHHKVYSLQSQIESMCFPPHNCVTWPLYAISIAIHSVYFALIVQFILANYLIFPCCYDSKSYRYS